MIFCCLEEPQFVESPNEEFLMIKNIYAIFWKLRKTRNRKKAINVQAMLGAFCGHSVHACTCVFMCVHMGEPMGVFLLWVDSMAHKI